MWSNSLVIPTCLLQLRPSPRLGLFWSQLAGAGTLVGYQLQVVGHLEVRRWGLTNDFVAHLISGLHLGEFFWNVTVTAVNHHGIMISTKIRINILHRQWPIKQFFIGNVAVTWCIYIQFIIIYVFDVFQASLTPATAPPESDVDDRRAEPTFGAGKWLPGAAVHLRWSKARPRVKRSGSERWYDKQPPGMENIWKHIMSQFHVKRDDCSLDWLTIDDNCCSILRYFKPNMTITY